MTATTPAKDKEPHETADPRDELWEAFFDTYYDAYYLELLATRLVSKWLIADDITKVLVALTASGSAIAGWALWKGEAPGFVWAIASGLAAILATTHAALGVPSRLKDHGETKRWFSTLRTDLDTARMCMRINTEFDVDQFTAQLETLRKRLADGLQARRDDILQTRRFEIRAQDELDARLATETDP